MRIGLFDLNSGAGAICLSGKGNEFIDQPINRCPAQQIVSPAHSQKVGNIAPPGCMRPHLRVGQSQFPGIFEFAHGARFSFCLLADVIMPHRFVFPDCRRFMAHHPVKVSNNNFRALILSLGLATVSFAQVLVSASPQDTLPAPTGNVNDFAEAIDPATRERLEAVLQNLKSRTGIDLIVAVVKTTGGEDPYDYSLRLANDWKVGPRASGKTLLLVIATDNGQFFTQFSRAAQTALPDGLIGEMGRRMRPRFEVRDYNNGLLSGIQTFATTLGEAHHFTFADLDTKGGDVVIARTRPRTVESPVVVSDTPAESPSPETLPAATPSEAPEQTPAPTPVAEATPMAEPSPVIETTPTPSETPTPAMTPEAPSPEVTPDPEAAPVETPSATPAVAEASPLPSESPTTEVAKNTPARPSRSPVPTRPDPEGEKEKVDGVRQGKQDGIGKRR